MTVMVIAQRLSTIRSADIIYVIEGGAVVERGIIVDMNRISMSDRKWGLQKFGQPAAAQMENEEGLQKRGKRRKNKG